MHMASHDLFNMKLRTCLDTGSEHYYLEILSEVDNNIK